MTNHPIFGKVQVEQKLNNSKYNDKQRRDAKTFMSDGQQRPPYQPLSIPEERKTPKCPLCNRNHWLSQCDNFKKLHLGERYKFLRAKRLCVNCLTPGYFVHDSPKASFFCVPGCTKKHSTYLHEKKQRNEVTPPQTTLKQLRPQHKQIMAT